MINAEIVSAIHSHTELVGMRSDYEVIVVSRWLTDNVHKAQR